MRINIITTLEIDKDESENFKQEEINKIYDDFKEIIRDTHETGDLTCFSFINTDTNMQIEDEVEE